jgi:hypothetical protein
VTGRAGRPGGGLGTGGPFPAVRWQRRAGGARQPAGPGGQDVSQRAHEEGAPAQPAPGRPWPGKDLWMAGVSAARGRLREPTKRRRLTKPGQGQTTVQTTDAATRGNRLHQWEVLEPARASPPGRLLATYPRPLTSRDPRWRCRAWSGPAVVEGAGTRTGGEGQRRAPAGAGRLRCEAAGLPHVIANIR